MQQTQTPEQAKALQLKIVAFALFLSALMQIGIAYYLHQQQRPIEGLWPFLVTIPVEVGLGIFFLKRSQSSTKPNSRGR